jgi:C1A family cysteine protease
MSLARFHRGSVVLLMAVCAGPATAAPRALPRAVDLRPRFAAFGLTAQTQGARGTCSVFAMTGVLEFEYARGGAKGLRLSAEFLNWASHQTNGRDTDGSFFSDALKGLEMRGVCEERLLPYQAKFAADLAPSPAALADAATRRDVSARWIKRWNVKTGLTEHMLKRLKRSLADGHPVAMGMRWPKHEQYTKGGVLVVPKSAADVFDGHSIILVGYADDAAQPGGGTFIFRNHAGPNWRQRGHARLPYAYVQAYGNDALGLRLGAVPGPPTPRTP